MMEVETYEAKEMAERSSWRIYIYKMKKISIIYETVLTFIYIYIFLYNIFSFFC